MDFNDITINLTDIIFFFIIVISFFIGFFRGFIREAFALTGWFVSGWVAIKYYKLLALHIREFINPQILADAISFGVIFLIIIVLAIFVTNILAKNIQNSLLAPLDKLLGIIFSIIRSFLIISIISICLEQTIWKEKPFPTWITESNSYTFIKSINKIIIKFIPDDAFSLNSESINIENIIDNSNLFTNQDTNNVDSSEGSYTPSDRNQMEELNNEGVIESDENN